jgi:hypothetical protein
VVTVVRVGGVAPKLMAQAMGVSQYWLRRWMRQTPGCRPITADIVDRLDSMPSRRLLMDDLRRRMRELEIRMFDRRPTLPTVQ